MIKRIVVVEEDPATRDLLAEILDCEGFATLCYPPWLISAACIDNAQPDLVLLDLAYNDPGQTLLLIEQLRQRPSTSGIPVIVNSTERHLLSQLSIPLDRLGCTTLAKPFELEELLLKINACVEQNQQRRWSGRRSGFCCDRPHLN